MKDNKNADFIILWAIFICCLISMMINIYGILHNRLVQAEKEVHRAYHQLGEEKGTEKPIEPKEEPEKFQYPFQLGELVYHKVFHRGNPENPMIVISYRHTLLNGLLVRCSYKSYKREYVSAYFHPFELTKEKPE